MRGRIPQSVTNLECIYCGTPCLYAMPTELPYAADAEVSLSYDELQACITPPHTPCPPLQPKAYNDVLQVLRLQYQKELAQSHITVQTKFNFAWGLVKSPMRENQVEGVRLLQGESSSQYLACRVL